jgi:hypothetical protein
MILKILFNSYHFARDQRVVIDKKLLQLARQMILYLERT